MPLSVARPPAHAPLSPPPRTDFRGALDEVRGDAPNVAVREAAKELMTAVFDTSAAATGQRMAGYGNSLRYLHML